MQVIAPHAACHCRQAEDRDCGHRVANGSKGVMLTRGGAHRGSCSQGELLTGGVAHKGVVLTRGLFSQGG